MPDPNPRAFDETAWPEVRDDRLCDRFEFLLKAGQGVEVHDFLRAEGLDPDAHPELAAHLGRVEAHYRADGETRAVAGASAGGPTDLQPGMVFDGRYTLLKTIGGGGMGEVWAAQQERPVKRLVAVKVIKPGMDSRAVLARFEAERQALAVMNHPNIAQVFDAGTTPAGRPYFVMELVKGVNITKFCDTHTLTPKQRMALFVTVCEAIQHAHLKGIIHRDIKPSNVMVTTTDDTPVVKVIDFGIAKAIGDQLGDHTLTTAPGAILGTPEYMSPEQAGLNPQDIDMRSDVYSLGVLLYELLTGTTPVDRKSLKRAALAEVLRMVREVDAPRPSDKLSSSADLPNIAAVRGAEPKKLPGEFRGEVDWILLKALEKDRTRRYESATAFAADVRRHLNNEVVEARPPTVGYKLRKLVRRNRGPVVAAAAVFVALLGGVTGTTLGLIEANSQRDVANDAKGKADTQKGIAEANEQTAKANEKRAQDAEGVAQREKRNALAVAASSTLDRGQLLCENGDVIRGLSLLVESLRLATEGSDRDLEEAVRVNLSAWLPHSYKFQGEMPGDHQSACLSPDGHTLIAGTGRGEVQIWNTKTLQKNVHEITIPNAGAILRLAWQPKGDCIAILCADGSLRLWKYGSEMSDAKVLQVSKRFPPGPHGALAFKPDGTEILVGTTGESVLRVETVKAEIVGDGFPHGEKGAGVDAVCWSRDGTRIVVGTTLGSVRVFDSRTAQPLTQKVWTIGNVTALAMSPDGSQFATAHGVDHSVRVWETRTGQLISPRLPTDGPPLTLQFSADGESVMAGGWTVRTQLWNWRTGRHAPGYLPGPALTIHSTPNPHHIMISSQAGTRKWEMPHRDLRWTSVPLSSSALCVAFSPDGTELAVSGATHKSGDKPGGLPYVRRLRCVDGSLIGDLTIEENKHYWSMAIQYAPNSQTLFATRGPGVTAWSLKSGQTRQYIDPGSLTTECARIAASPDGKYVAASNGNDEKAIVAWDIDSGRPVFRDTSRSTNGFILGFFPGTSKLFATAGGVISTWDLALQEPVRRKAFETGFDECYGAVYSNSGPRMSFISYGRLREFNSVTGQPTGVIFSGIKNTNGYYTPSQTMIFLNELTRNGARHLRTRKAIGPHFGESECYGVSPDGEWLVTIGPRKQVQLWKIPKPMMGSPAEVAQILVDHIGPIETDDDQPKFLPPNRSVALPPLPVFDSRELHNADLDELKKWFAALPKSHRPIHITSQEGSNGKRFDALAIDDGTNTEFDVRLGVSSEVDDKTMWARGWSQAIRTMYFPPGSSGLNHVVWAKGMSYGIAWADRDAAVTLFRTQRKRPVGIVQYDDNFFMNGAPDNGLKWELHHGLTAAQVKEKVDEARKRKWRPSLVHRHRYKADLFVLVLVDNPHDTAWEYHAPLSLKEYETKLADAKGRGLRPEYVHSWVEKDQPVYSVVLIGDYRPPSKEVLPAPRPDK